MTLTQMIAGILFVAARDAGIGDEHDDARRWLLAVHALPPCTETWGDDDPVRCEEIGPHDVHRGSVAWGGL